MTLRKIEDFFSRDGQLPVDDEGLVQYAQVIVRLEDRRAVEVAQVSYFQYRTHADGRLDRQHLGQVMATAGEAALGGLSPSKKPPGVVSAEHRFAQRRLDHMTHWTPTKAEEELLRGLVNRKAGRDLL